MTQVIINAIEQRLLISFIYKGKTRVVEPHTYGVQHNGNESLSAWQLSGGSGEDFRLYVLDEMTSIETLEETFAGPRAGFQQEDKRYARILAEL